MFKLSKLELLREKLALMRFMGSFDERISALNEVTGREIK
jgi:hypothetical protein